MVYGLFDVEVCVVDFDRIFNFDKWGNVSVSVTIIAFVKVCQNFFISARNIFFEIFFISSFGSYAFICTKIDFYICIRKHNACDVAAVNDAVVVV